MKHFLLTILTLLLLPSCSLIEDTPAVCPVDPADTFTMSFHMMTPVAAPDSRTDGQGHPEVNSEYARFEDGIDVSDLALFIFARVIENNNPTPEILVLKTTDFLSSPQLSITGSEGSYIVNLTILRSQLKEALGIDVDPNSDKNISFRMLMLANSATAAHSWSSVTATTFSGIIGELNNWSFPMTDLYPAPGTATSPAGDVYPADDIRSLYGKKHIPMFGTNTFMVSQDQLYYSRPDNRIYLGELSLLRSLAKVRVVDNIQEKDVDGYPKIVAASIFGTQPSARFLPAEAESYENGTQVHTPNIASNVAISIANQEKYPMGTIPDSWIEPSVAKTGNVRIGFIPEQQINWADRDLSKGLPYFHITIATLLDEDGIDVLEDYDIPMVNFYKDEQNPGFGTNILRNHIYTLSINAVNANLDCTVDLVPYRGCVLEPSFGVERD